MRAGLTIVGDANDIEGLAGGESELELRWPTPWKQTPGVSGGRKRMAHTPEVRTEGVRL